MITQSPNFKLNPMTPLSVHQKLALIEDEPHDLELEEEHSKISFNENLIVCIIEKNNTLIVCTNLIKMLEKKQQYNTYTNIYKTILKLKGQPNIGWVNPIFKFEKIRSTSILKCSQSPIRICSISP